MSKTSKFGKKKTQGNLEIKVMCKVFFKEVDHIDCKIIAYSTPCRTRSRNFRSSWLKAFALHKS
jgi:hypothetical protein